jgi:hypothetical protein
MVAFIAVLQALPQFIASLPYLFQIILKAMTLFERFITWTKTNQIERWINDLEHTIDKLEGAETPEQKRDAARSMVDLIRKLS